MDVAQFDFDYTDQKSFEFGLFSDLHIDSTGCNTSALSADLSALCDKGARIYFNGDVFDGILPTDRKRYARAGDQFGEDAQINARVEYVASFLKPYADHIDYIGAGNHEASIAKYNNCDILHLLASKLGESRSRSLSPIRRSGYVGFIRLVFRRGDGCVKSYVIYRDHGKGGSSPVTHGIINFNRLFTTYSCDLAWLGHTHSHVIDKNYQTIGVSSQGKLYKRPKIGVITPGYQMCFEERTYGENEYYRSNFPEERFSVPSPIGHATLTINVSNDYMEADVK